ncbi:4-alpha-glucanotransferase [Streptomyces sp. A7024]|uniref:4-alpha-glucanotransferase n=1 Tax=Streptomyces coryli TaxID=1128680 RepID=A0A6G4UCD6_9ACTN|nr:4-alpha-glucanotransferase [Streptomyces coryli]NGN69834.1 4-alpha-glucanotransferase [Streptomyces coryli]
MSLDRLAALHGVATSFSPAPGRTATVPEDTVVAVLAAMGVDASTPRAVRAELDAHARARPLLPAVITRRAIAGPGAPVPTGLPDGTELQVEAEDGATLAWSADLPPGVHTLHAAAPDGRTDSAALVAAPPRLPALESREHGLLVQLYSLLSPRSWGMGDLGDLAELAGWAARVHGAGFVQTGPLHAGVPGRPGEAADPSPYRPSSRRFPDPVHLRIEDIPEFRYLPPEHRARATELGERAAALRQGVLRQGGKGELIDRDAVWQLKLDALEIIREVELTPGRRVAYHAFLAEQGPALDDHATWYALAELHGPDWRSWPDGLADPRSAATSRARHVLLDRIDFHCWLAWLTDNQLARAQRIAKDAGMAVGIVHDLAVGVHPSGADAWAQQDSFAAGMSIGAPPDAFNPHGQDWGLPPWRPDALAAGGFGPYREVLRNLLRHAGALRIDHVMGLSRLWWVPEGAKPAHGTYVTYDQDAMLGVLALEAHRAGAPVIGEDLGTVAPAMREALAERGVLGTSVLWFERDYGDGATGHAPPLPPERWRPDCLAAATTHDLPSTASRLTGGHVELRHRLGLLDVPQAQAAQEEAVEVGEWLELLARTGLLGEGPHDAQTAIAAVYRYLARTPARLIGVWLPDTVGDLRPQNLPGTVTGYPNWRLPIADAEGTPVTLDELATSPRVHDLLTQLRDELGH